MWFLSSALDLNESQLNHSQLAHLSKLLKIFCLFFFLMKRVLASLFLIFVYLFLAVALRIFDYGMRTLSYSVQDLVP